MPRRQKRLVPGRDYRIDPDGACVLTREYLLSVGVCCNNRCRYCPYEGPAAPDGPPVIVPPESDPPAVRDPR